MKIIIEMAGIVVLALIVVGVLTTPQFFQVGFNNVIYLQVVTAILMCCVSLVRLRGEVSNRFLLLFGFLCFSAGGGVFIFIPDYFVAGANSSMGLWHRLSFYALPSIALEGGIATLLLAHLNKTQGIPMYIKMNKQLSLLFVLYTIHFVSLSFLVVLGFVNVSWHMAITKSIMIIVLMLQVVAWKKIKF